MIRGNDVPIDELETAKWVVAAYARRAWLRVLSILVFILFTGTQVARDATSSSTDSARWLNLTYPMVLLVAASWIGWRRVRIRRWARVHLSADGPMNK
jgi:hypothetical protein